MYEIRKYLLDTEKPVTAENIKTLLIGKEIKEDAYMLMQIFQQHNSLMAKLEALKADVLQSHYLHVDETPIKVLDKDKKGQTHRGFIGSITIALIKQSFLIIRKVEVVKVRWEY